MQTRHVLTILLLLLMAPQRAVQAQQPAQLRIAAAASLTDVMQELGKLYQQQQGVTTAFSFASSSTLARQIEAGARVDVFISADAEWLDYLEQRSALKPGTRRNLLGNTLVLIAPADRPVSLKLVAHADLRSHLAGSRLAIADPESVPAGKYARMALVNLGIWSTVSQQLVLGDNVRTTLNFVSRGEAPLGIVYGTDARADSNVMVVATFPRSSHAPIVYPVAASRSGGPHAQQFIDWLFSAPARAVFQRYGFVPLP